MKRQREKIKAGVQPAPKRKPRTPLAAASSDSEKPLSKSPRKRPDKINPGSSSSKRKAQQSNNDVESQTAASSRAPTMSNTVEFCQCCRASNATKKWAAADAAGNGQVSGQQCEECDLLHKHCFRYLEWSDMCQRYLDSGSQGSTYLPCVVVAQ